MFVLFSPTLGGTLDDFITRQNINWSTERAFVWNIKSHFPLPLTSAALPCTTPQPPTAPLVSLPLFPAGIRGGEPVPGHVAAFSLLKERVRSCLPCRGRVQHTAPGSAVHFAPAAPGSLQQQSHRHQIQACFHHTKCFILSEGSDPIPTPFKRAVTLQCKRLSCICCALEQSWVIPIAYMTKKPQWLNRIKSLEEW